MRPIEEMAFSVLPVDNGGFVLFISLTTNRAQPKNDKDLFASIFTHLQQQKVMKFFCRDAYHVGQIVVEELLKNSVPVRGEIEEVIDNE